MCLVIFCSAVKKNLRVAGLMSADHKKKLLWGGKKTQVEQVGYLNFVLLIFGWTDLVWFTKILLFSAGRSFYNWQIL